jgi:hypothetical protein
VIQSVLRLRICGLTTSRAMKHPQIGKTIRNVTSWRFVISHSPSNGQYCHWMS